MCFFRSCGTGSCVSARKNLNKPVEVFSRVCNVDAAQGLVSSSTAFRTRIYSRGDRSPLRWKQGTHQSRLICSCDPCLHEESPRILCRSRCNPSDHGRHHTFNELTRQKARIVIIAFHCAISLYRYHCILSNGLRSCCHVNRREGLR